jgi:tetratricopeptide (TPR) repeat protein
VLLVFRFLTHLTSDEQAACWGAMLFALHPLQVESVAWTSEQRGLLAAMFSLLSLLAYMTFRAGLPREHGASSGWAYYVWASVAFLMALLAKPSSASVPLLAAGLDLFVLHRSWRVSLAALLPWLALSVGMFLITRSEQPASALSFVPPLWARPLVAGDAMAFYLAKLVWPLDLGILYRRSPEYVLSQAWLLASGLAPLLLLAILAWSRFRAGLLAAAWFTTALLPVLGLMPFIHQRYSTVADRYMYLAMVGPAYLLAWWVTRSQSWWKRAACVVMLLLCGMLSFRQAGHWRDSAHLYRQALVANPFSDTAHASLSRCLMQDDPLTAQRHLERALEINPRSALAHYNQGVLLEQQGNQQAAAGWYQRAIELDPSYHYAHVNLGVLHLNQGRYEEAVSNFEAALRIAPSDLAAGFNRGLALQRAGRTVEAMEQFRRVLDDWPDHHPSRVKLGMLLAAQGARQQAIEEFRRVLAKQSEPSAHAELAAALMAEGDLASALDHYRQALAIESPVWPAIAGRVALILATHPSADIRDGRQAVALAEEACRRSNYQSPDLLGALAAAKAEVGEFAEAVTRAQQAHDLAAELGQPQLAGELAQQLQHYRQNRPVRALERRSSSLGAP